LLDRWLGMFAQQRLRHHELARLAPAALRHLFVDPCLLESGELAVLGEALNRRDLLPGDLAHGRDAGVGRLPIYVHEAHRAFADAAAELRTRELQIVSERPQERVMALPLDRDGLAVHGELIAGCPTGLGCRALGLA